MLPKTYARVLILSLLILTAVTPLLGNITMSAETRIPVEYPCLASCLRPTS